MTPRIETLTARLLVGKRLKMSLAGNQTLQLWQSFMPLRGEITNAVSLDLYSLQRYPPSYFDPFDPNKEFEKWAAMEVSDVEQIPDGLEAFYLPGGLYAVFDHRGGPATGPQTFQAILGSWLPNSPYLLDDRPHFELLGEKYKHNDPLSEEEIWMPIKEKHTQ